MKKSNSQTILIIWAIIFFWISIPLLLANIVIRSLFKGIYLKTKKSLSFVLFAFLLIISITLFALGIYRFTTINTFFDFSLRTPPIDNFLNLFFNILSIGALISFPILLISFFIHFAFRKIYLNKKQKLEQIKLEILNQNEITNQILKQQNWFIYKFFCFDIYEIKKENFAFNKTTKTNKPINGIMLNNKTIIPDFALKTHISIMGITGSGKTNTIFQFIKYAIQNKKPLIFIDGKGDPKLPQELKVLCDQNNHQFSYWTLQENKNSQNYNPFKNKNKSQVVSMLVEMSGYSRTMEKQAESSFYRQMERAILEFVIPVLFELKIPISFANIAKYTSFVDIKNLIQSPENVKLLDPETFNQIQQLRTEAKAMDLSIPEQKANKKSLLDTCDSLMKNYLEKYNNIINAIDKQHWNNLTTKLNLLAKSINTINENGFGLDDILNNKQVMLFSIQTLNDMTNAKMVADLIIQDIKQSAHTNQINNNATMVILDEFGELAIGDGITTLLAQGRSMGYETILSFQSLGQLKKISPDFKDVVLGNTQTLIVHQLTDVNSAEEVAKSIGTKRALNKTYQTTGEDSTNTRLSGQGTHKVVDEFLLNPNQIKYLKVGEAGIKTLNQNRETVYLGIQKIDFFNSVN